MIICDFIKFHGIGDEGETKARQGFIGTAEYSSIHLGNIIMRDLGAGEGRLVAKNK